MPTEEITARELDPEQFIAEKVAEISATVGDGMAINALSGGVDSAAVTMLGHRALGDRLKTCFVDNALMRAGEPEQIMDLFASLGVEVALVDAREEFLEALAGITDPEEKRDKGITEVFYKDVFGKLVADCGAKVLLQGTNYTDVEETVGAGGKQR